MKVQIKDISTDSLVAAEVVKANFNDMPLKKDGWQFTWRELFRKQSAAFYKLVLENSPYKIEGMIMLSLLDGGIVFMDSIEVAPHNYGSKGRYDSVAGRLIAYGSNLSFELGKPPYDGCLSFESKTVLMELCLNKYGASMGLGQRMFFSPEAGFRLMELYLQGS